MKLADYLPEVPQMAQSLINLNEHCLEGVEIPEKCEKPKDAYLMIIRNYLHKDIHKDFIKELQSYEWDRKYYDVRRKKVLNKRARENVCYGKKSRETNYEKKLQKKSFKFKKKKIQLYTKKKQNLI